MARRTKRKVDKAATSKTSEPETRKMTSRRLPPLMRTELRILATTRGTTLQKMLREAAEAILASASGSAPKPQSIEATQVKPAVMPMREVNYEALAEVVKEREPGWPGWRPGTKQRGVFLFWRRLMLEFVVMLAFAEDGMTAEQMIDGLSPMTRLEAAAAGQKLKASLVKDRLRPRMEHKDFFVRDGDVYGLKSPITGADRLLRG